MGLSRSLVFLFGHLPTSYSIILETFDSPRITIHLDILGNIQPDILNTVPALGPKYSLFVLVGTRVPIFHKVLVTRTRTCQSARTR